MCEREVWREREVWPSSGKVEKGLPKMQFSLQFLQFVNCWRKPASHTEEEEELSSLSSSYRSQVKEVGLLFFLLISSSSSHA